MGCAYERELKGILGGDESVLDRVTRAGPPDQTQAYRRIVKAPFLMVRAAGSLGADLVALRRDIAFPIEVKAAARDVVHFSEGAGKLHQQALEMARCTSRAGVLALYAMRRKNVRADDAWRMFALPADGLEGRARILQLRLPKVSATASGTFVLRWHEGLALHKFIEYLCPDVTPVVPVRTLAPVPA